LLKEEEFIGVEVFLIDVGQVESHPAFGLGIYGEHQIEALLFGEFADALAVDGDKLLFVGWGR
jgi:hypothetical protein